jgi:trehalose 2-sulfotransferase
MPWRDSVTGIELRRLPPPWFARAVPGPTRPRGEIDSYLLCTTPRTGSTLLCGLLDSTGVAGHPESYFRRQGQQEYAVKWGIARSAEGNFIYSDYIQAALTAGRTDNGVFAVRIMWETLGELLGELEPMNPGLPGVSLLERAFGRTRFVYLRRDDVVAQAVSLVRAEQTNVWHDPIPAIRPAPEHDAWFDFAKIERQVQEMNQHNAAWQEWFRAAGIEPFPVRYEELDVDPVGITRRILDFLGLDLPPTREITVRHRRLSDELNAGWIAQYHADARAK